MDRIEFEGRISTGPRGNPIVHIPVAHIRAIGEEWILESLSMRTEDGGGCDMRKCRIIRSGTNRYVNLDCDWNLIGRKASFSMVYGVE